MPKAKRRHPTPGEIREVARRLDELQEHCGVIGLISVRAILNTVIVAGQGGWLNELAIACGEMVEARDPENN